MFETQFQHSRRTSTVGSDLNIAAEIQRKRPAGEEQHIRCSETSAAKQKKRWDERNKAGNLHRKKQTDTRKPEEQPGSECVESRSLYTQPV